MAELLRRSGQAIPGSIPLHAPAPILLDHAKRKRA